MYTLSDGLRAVRLTGAFFFDVHAKAPWCAETPFGHTVVDAMFPGSDHLICYHLMMEGSCWATIEGEEPVKLSAGDIILLPHGDTHVRATAPGMRKTPEMSMYRMPEDRELPTRISVGDDGGELTHFVCGFLGCDSRPFNPLLTALPTVIHLSATGQHAATGWLTTLLNIAVKESGSARAGGENVLARLSELMFVEAIRSYLETLPPAQTAWLAGLRDPIVGQALAALHRQPG